MVFAVTVFGAAEAHTSMAMTAALAFVGALGAVTGQALSGWRWKTMDTFALAAVLALIGLIALQGLPELGKRFEVHALDPYDARGQLLLWAGIIVGFLAGRSGGSTRNPAVLVRWLAMGAGGFGVVAIVNYLVAPDQILVWTKTAHLDRLTGTFRSANTAAAFFGAGFCVAGGALLQSARSRRYRGLPPTVALLRLSGDRSGTVMALLSTGFASALTQSRGGLISLVVGLGVLAVLSNRRRPETGRRSRRGCALVVFAAGLALLLAVVALLRRIGGLELDEDPRLAAFAMMWRAFKASPWTGWGAGGFDDMVRRFATGSDFMALNGIGAGHDIYLQALAETGVIGFGALVLAVGLFLLRSLQSQQRDQIAPAARAGLIGAIAVLLTQGLADYALNVPAMTVLFALLLGAASSAPAQRSSSPGPQSGSRRSQGPRSGWTAELVGSQVEPGLPNTDQPDR
jgi:O-antigen ligase